MKRFLVAAVAVAAFVVPQCYATRNEYMGSILAADTPRATAVRGRQNRAVATQYVAQFSHRIWLGTW